MLRFSKLLRSKSGGFRCNSRDIGSLCRSGARGSRRPGGQTSLKRLGQKAARRALRILLEEEMEALGEPVLDPLACFRPSREEAAEKELRAVQSCVRTGYALWVFMYDTKYFLGIYTDKSAAERARALEEKLLVVEGWWDQGYDQVYITEVPIFGR